MVAESTDKSTLLLGEVKWIDNISVKAIRNELEAKIENTPFIQNRKVLQVLFLKQPNENKSKEIIIIKPADIIAVLK